MILTLIGKIKIAWFISSNLKTVTCNVLYSLTETTIKKYWPSSFDRFSYILISMITTFQRATFLLLFSTAHTIFTKEYYVLQDTSKTVCKRFIEKPKGNLLNIYWHWIPGAMIDRLFCYMLGGHMCWLQKYETKN